MIKIIKSTHPLIWAIIFILLSALLILVILHPLKAQMPIAGGNACTLFNQCLVSGIPLGGLYCSGSGEKISDADNCSCNDISECVGYQLRCNPGEIAGWGFKQIDESCSNTLCYPGECSGCNLRCLADGSGALADSQCNFLCPSLYVDNQMGEAEDADFWINGDGKFGPDENNFIHLDSTVFSNNENSLYVTSDSLQGSFIILEVVSGSVYDTRYNVTKNGNEVLKGISYIKAVGSDGNIWPSVNYGSWLLGEESLILDSNKSLIYGKINSQSDGDFVVLQTFTCPSGPVQLPANNPTFSYLSPALQTVAKKDKFNLLDLIQGTIVQAASDDPQVNLAAFASIYTGNPYLPPDTRCPSGYYSDVFKITKNGSISLAGSLTVGGPIYSGIANSPVIIASGDGLAVINNGNIDLEGMLMVGHNNLNVESGQNLIYGNIDANSQGNLLLLQKENLDKFKVDKDGNTTINGRLNNHGGLEVIGNDGNGSCLGLPSQFSDGTMYICAWCQNSTKHRALKVYLLNNWVTLQESTAQGSCLESGGR